MTQRGGQEGLSGRHRVPPKGKQRCGGGGGLGPALSPEETSASGPRTLGLGTQGSFELASL